MPPVDNLAHAPRRLFGLMVSTGKYLRNCMSPYQLGIGKYRLIPVLEDRQPNNVDNLLITHTACSKIRSIRVKIIGPDQFPHLIHRLSAPGHRSYAFRKFFLRRKLYDFPQKIDAVTRLAHSECRHGEEFPTKKTGLALQIGFLVDNL
jgi:hypothetical protein